MNDTIEKLADVLNKYEASSPNSKNQLDSDTVLKMLTIIKELTSAKENEIKAYNKMLCTISSFADPDALNLLNSAIEAEKKDFKHLDRLKEANIHINL